MVSRGHKLLRIRLKCQTQALLEAKGELQVLRQATLPEAQVELAR